MNCLLDTCTFLWLADEHIWLTSKLQRLHADPFDRLLIAQAPS